jgi:hypothetical protein
VCSRCSAQVGHHSEAGAGISSPAHPRLAVAAFADLAVSR